MSRLTKTTCVHEAGHGVAALLVGESIHALHAATRDGISVDRKGRKIENAHGLAELSITRPLPGMLADVRTTGSEDYALADAYNRRNIFVSLAGDMAQARLSGGYFATQLDYGLGVRRAYQIAAAAGQPQCLVGLGDKGDVAYFLIEGGVPAEDVSTVLDAAFYAVQVRVCRGAGWRAVCAIAEGLMKSGGYIDGDVAHALAEPLLADVQRLGFDEFIFESEVLDRISRSRT
jgi:hypothetical protein